MVLLDAVRMAWDAIRSNKLRSGLTLLGIVIGVFAVIASVTAVRVIDVYFHDTIQFLGSNTFTVQKYPGVNLGRPDESIRNRDNITYEQMERLRDRLDLAASVSREENFAQARIKYRDRATDPNVSVTGSDEFWAVNHSFELAAGRFLSEQDVQFGRAVVVLGATVDDRLFPAIDPLGKRVTIDGNRFTVIGVMEAKGSAFGQDQDRFVAAPITRLLPLYGGGDRRDIQIMIRVSDVSELPAAQEEVIGHLRAI